MKEKEYKLNDELTVQRKEDPTGEDLIALKELGFDPVFNPDDTAGALMQCHYDKEKMLKLVNVLSDKKIDKLNKGVSGKKMFELLQDFFLPFGIHFQ